MRYCKKCGNQLSDDMLFCQKCGTKVEAAAKGERPAAAYPVLENIESTPTKQKAKNKNGARVFGIIALVLIVIIFIATIGSNNNDNSNNADSNNQSQVVNNGNSTEQKQDEKKSGEDYELLVWEAFWEGASDYFGVEYSAYKMWDTVYDYIQDFETSDGYTAHYYLIRTAFETTNVLGQKITHQVTARCYYAPEYSNTVYTTYMTLNGETVYYDEETECWLMDMDDGGSAPATSEESTGILWSAFVSAYNEMAAEDPEGNGYLIDAEISGNTLEYSFPNGETLSVDVTNGKHIIRMEYIYPSTGTSDQTIIMHRWWVISSIVGAIQHELHGNDWSDAVSTKTEDILADVALAGGSDEDKATYQSGKALTSSDLEHSIIYTRYVDIEASMSHFIVYGYGNNTYSNSDKTASNADTSSNSNEKETNEKAAYVPSDDMNEFLVRFILPQYVDVNGKHTDPVEHDSNESTDWCYKLEGKVGADIYEAMVYPFCDINNNVEDLWIRYLYWNGELIIENDPSEQIHYSPKKYW